MENDKLHEIGTNIQCITSTANLPRQFIIEHFFKD